MNAYTKDNLDEMTISEVQGFQKELKDYTKDRLMSEKEAIVDAFKNTIEVGDNASFLYKDGEAEGKVVKINEKSFTVEFEVDGDTIKRAIQFHRFIAKIYDKEAVA